MASFQDGHFAVRAPTTRAATLPVQFELVQNQILLSFVDCKKLPESEFSFSVGDELVEVDGKPALSTAQDMLPFVGTGNPKTAKMTAVWSLTSRRAARLPLPENKTITFKIRRGTSSLIETATLNWNFSGEQIDENETLQINVSEQFHFGNLESKLNFADARNPNVEFAGPYADRRYMCNPISRIEIPSDATVITSAPFTSYIYPTAKGLVGYLRIPDYYPTDENSKFSEEVALKWFERYRYVVTLFEKQTIGLVIDQDHNCGGSVSLVEDMEGLFINKPFSAQQFKLRANKATYLELKNELTNQDPISLGYQYLKDLVALVEKAYRGTSSLTEMTTVTGRKMIYPDRLANYTKPILILIDELAGSGGDAFPSMMKGEGRARLFGQQTSGLGGSVGTYPALFHSQMSINMTATQFYKPDGSPVENNGAIPDQTYEITRDDLMYGYKLYQKAYTEELLKMIPSSTSFSQGSIIFWALVK